MTRKCVFSYSRIFIPLIILLCLLALVLPSSVINADGVVKFPDPNLEAAIRDELRKPAGDIYESELARLSRLSALDRDLDNNIVDLTGLEYCTSLTSLWLPVNEISDITPLSSLTNLSTIYLGWNSISDISPLSSLTRLTILDLRNNQISDISALSGLTNLTELYLGTNQISDISALSSLTSLSRLYLDVNQIENVSPLVANAGLSLGDLLFLCGNPLSEDSESIYIPELQERGVCVTCPIDTAGWGNWDCFIATAAYGTSSAAEVDTLRAFRDGVLLRNSLGSQLVALYYEVSPPVADFIYEHDVLRTLVREFLVDPAVWAVKATEALWRD